MNATLGWALADFTGVHPVISQQSAVTGPCGRLCCTKLRQNTINFTDKSVFY